VNKAAEALAFHVEGLAEDGSVPQPRTLDALRKDKHFRADAKGAMIVLVPNSSPSKAMRINITLDQSLSTRVDQAAARAGETRSGFLATAAKKRLAESV
jgi:hypothetical protein